MKFILGKKVAMTQMFDAEGHRIPVTIVSAPPCVITQVKGMDAHGYTAIQVGTGFSKRLNKSLQGHFKGLGSFRSVREFRVAPDQMNAFERGKTIDLGWFETGEYVDVVGISKGRGFQGVVKRHGFKGSPATHGHKDQLRHSGSIGAGGVARVPKGRRMGGRMGGDRVTAKNLKIMNIDREQGMVWLSGAVPGSRGSVVAIRAA